MSAIRKSTPAASKAVVPTPRRSYLAPITHHTPAEHAALGKSARAKVPRQSHAAWNPPADRRDPIEILEEQALTRVAELIPIRYGRMLVSAFAFFRGGAAIMAADLAATPISGLRTQLCGDAHLSNFGAFASPERRLVFDINDFDETLPGPWEWDVKRLAASLEITGRDRAFKRRDRRAAVVAAVQSYRSAMASFADMSSLGVWYASLDIDAIMPEIRKEIGAKQSKIAEHNLSKARTKDSMKAFRKLTTMVDGRPKIVSDPPLIVPISELFGAEETAVFERYFRRLIRQYRSSLQNDRRILVERFEYADLARKVVGVGSVGTRAWIMLMLGRDEQDPLFLQVKEAQPSVLEPFEGASAFRNHGQRVVEGQRLMQASSDIFLGWLHTKGVDGVERDFYLRQLWDWKLSANMETVTERGLVAYARLCGWTLARAHARAGDRIAMAAYMGSSSAFDEAVADFSAAYADQNEADYVAFKQAVETGRLQVMTGV